MVYIGIDPGSSSGALVVLNGSTSFTSAYRFKKLTPKELFTLFTRVSKLDNECTSALERIHPFASRGARSMFTFWQHYGMLRLCLEATGISYINPLPQKWQKHFDLVGKYKETRTDGSEIKSKDARKKAANLDKAKELFPQVEIHPEEADAYLLAAYCRDIHRSNNEAI